MASPEDIEAFLSNPKEKKETKTYTNYNELPENIKTELKQRIPESILKSDLCKVIVTVCGDGSTSISVQYLQ